MKVENSELEAFVAVAELGSFQKAADKLHLTQPGLSRRIQKLEQALGVELFHRTTRSVALTGVGRQFLPMARQQISQLGTMLSSIREIAEKRFGKVRLASIPTVVSRVLPDVLRQYARKYPHIGVQIFDGNHDFVLGQVRAGLAEFGISLDPGDDEDLTFEPLLADRYVLAVHREHEWASRESVSLRDLPNLREARFVIGGRDSGNRLLLELLLGHESISLRWFYEVEHISCVVALVDAGLGCAIVPSLAVSAHFAPNIRAITIASPEVQRAIGIVKHRHVSMSSIAADLCGLLQRSLG
ncbi:MULTISPECIES: LysR family transcriptional regulator [unclassified Caballeronia]|uniref:LysR family transcriptional regulator n=1 Tax=unclassified Caballeronia TaxID=2646786 RepID=UPI00286099EB|nr:MULTISPECIES: LysR family transcriptional regulator [unclassified Caballeronia]MDR5817283.1 LysR family transcriptional regulator [Caballeronia sp. LZ033]MDR5824194.1 LysR family transcriptional regulator [Caballeronia sp. LZ043]MDR5882088.1 LysR family transcriptional regulator [Caballeronia sp. LZ032]